MRLPSAAPVSFPLWPPNLRLERQGGYLSPALGRLVFVGGLVARSVAPLAVLG